MPKKKKENRGGSGRNQGRKLKYGEETVKVNYRVPVSMKPELDGYVSNRLSEYEKAAKGSTQRQLIGEGRELKYYCRCTKSRRADGFAPLPPNN